MDCPRGMGTASLGTAHMTTGTGTQLPISQGIYHTMPYPQAKALIPGAWGPMNLVSYSDTTMCPSDAPKELGNWPKSAQ